MKYPIPMHLKIPKRGPVQPPPRPFREVNVKGRIRSGRDRSAGASHVSGFLLRIGR